MSRYEPLQRFLSGCRESETPMTFGEVEKILNRNLPESARKHQAWWANTRSHSHAESWLEAGFRTERLDLGGERVVFVRDIHTPPAVSNPKGEALVVELSAFSGAGMRLIDDYAEEHDCSRGEAIVSLLNAAGLERRKALLDWFSSRWTGKPGSDSVDLIREDRDSR